MVKVSPRQVTLRVHWLPKMKPIQRYEKMNMCSLNIHSNSSLCIMKSLIWNVTGQNKERNIYIYRTQKNLQSPVPVLFLRCYCSVARSCLTLWDPMDCSMLVSSVLHYLLQSAQFHVHWIRNAIQPFYPLAPPFPLALSLSQHQGLFQWVSSSHQVAMILELQLEHRSLQWTFRIDFFLSFFLFFLRLTGLISLQSKGLSSIFSSTTVQKHQFFGAQQSLWSSRYPHMTTGKKQTSVIQTFIS